MTEPASVEIDGTMYAIPTLDTFDLDEAEILYGYSGCALEDFAPGDDTAPEADQRAYVEGQLAKIKNPGFKRALVHIAYRRAHPDTPTEEIKRLIGTANMLAVTLAVFAGDEEDPTQSSPNEQQNDNGSKTASDPASSGSSSPSGSNAPGNPPESTGHTRLVTSSPASPLGTSAS